MGGDENFTRNNIIDDDDDHEIHHHITNYNGRYGQKEKKITEQNKHPKKKKKISLKTRPFCFCVSFLFI